MSDPIDLAVDLDALQQLCNRLTLIHDSLANAKDDVEAYEAALGSPRVAAKLHSFTSGWKDGRKKIEGNVDKLVGKVQGVAQTYLEQEKSFVHAYGSSGPGASPTATPSGRGH